MTKADTIHPGDPETTASRPDLNYQEIIAKGLKSVRAANHNPQNFDAVPLELKAELPKVQESIKGFVDHVLPTLPLGPKTKELFLNKIVALERPGALVLDNRPMATFQSHANFTGIPGVGSDTHLRMEVGNVADGVGGVIATAAQETNITELLANPSRLAKLKLSLPVWHELGHMLDSAELEARDQSHSMAEYWKYRPPMFSGESELLQTINNTVAAERFAHGLAVHAMTRYVAEEYRLTDQQTELFSHYLVTKNQRKDSTAISRVVLEHEDDPRLAAEPMLSELSKLRVSYRTPQSIENYSAIIGYGDPLRSQQINRILGNTP